MVEPNLTSIESITVARNICKKKVAYSIAVLQSLTPHVIDVSRTGISRRKFVKHLIKW